MFRIENPYGIPGLPTQVPTSYVSHSKGQTIQQLFEQAQAKGAPLYPIAITCSKGNYTIYDGLLIKEALVQKNYNDPITGQPIDQIYFYAIGKEGIFRPLLPISVAVSTSIRQQEAEIEALARVDQDEASSQASRLGPVCQLQDEERLLFIQERIKTINQYALRGLDPDDPLCNEARHIVAVAYQELQDGEQASLWETAYLAGRRTIGSSSNPNGLRVDASALR